MSGSPRTKETISSLFPEPGRILLTGTGKQFIERVGVEVVRRIVLGVMMGENIDFLTAITIGELEEESEPKDMS